MSKRCYQSVYWWDGEYEANCVLPEGHSGNHVDELGSWFNDDNEPVHNPTPEDLKNEQEAQEATQALSTSTSSGIEADTKPSSTLEENIRQLLQDFYEGIACDIGPEDSNFNVTIPALLSLYQKELVRDTAKLRADLAGAMGHMQGCGHTYEYLVKNYPELQGKLTGEQP